MRLTARRSMIFAVVMVVSWACGAQPQPTKAPPLIEAVGRLSSVSQGEAQVDYLFEDGRAFSFSTNDRRLLTATPGGDLAILGRDAEGPFAAAFMPQGGLPADCYVDNSEGIEWTSFVELRGVLWRKSAGFIAEEAIPAGQRYPLATRFCLNEAAEITRTVRP